MRAPPFCKRCCQLGWFFVLPILSAGAAFTHNAAHAEESSQVAQRFNAARLAHLTQINSKRPEMLAKFADIERRRAAIADAVSAAQGNFDSARQDEQRLEDSEKRQKDSSDYAKQRLARARDKKQAAQRELDAANHRYCVILSEVQGFARHAESVRSQWLELLDVHGRLTAAEHEPAIEQFEAWLKQDQNNSGALLGRAVANWRSGKLPQAQRDLNELINANEPGVAGVLAIRAMVLCESGDVRHGMADFGKALKADKRCQLIYTLRARAYLLQSNATAAERELRAAVQLDTQVAEPLRMLALLQATSSKPTPASIKKSLAGAQKACELTNHQDWRCLEALAAAHAANDDFDQAQKVMQKAIQISWGPTQAQYRQWEQKFQAREAIHPEKPL